MSNSDRFIFKQEFLVTSADVDFQQNIRLSSLTNFLIQIAWKHAENLGWGIDDLHKQNLVWVLSAFKIQLDTYPNWRENITIETWPKGINRLFYLRDYHIFNSDGNIIGRATSSWLLINPATRRPKLVETDDEVFRKNLNKHAIAEPATVSKPEVEVVKVMEQTPKYSDIDINQHLTTTRYIDWMFDTYSPDEITEIKPAEISASFMKEIVFGEQVHVKRFAMKGGKVYFTLSSPSINKPFFTGELRLKGS